ncbi:hypothetical protein SCT_0795 [Sulfuricella sp. T08]|nr:hypothetical protein SCT_0795 [Sulfuricella sp. T08]
MLGLLFALGGDAGGANSQREPAMDERIGTLGVAGSQVFLNGTRALGGEAIHVGDTVTTGNASSGLIEFSDGGLFQLDQNTDPIFLVKRLQSGFCILAKILSGQVFVDKQPFCIDSPALDAINNSRINIRVTPQQTGITVLSGSVTVVRPESARILVSQQYIMTLQGEARTRQLSERELMEMLRWRKNYTFTGWCCKDQQVTHSDREQCGTAQFSFDRVLLEAKCRARDSPRFDLDFGLPMYPRHRPTEPPTQQPNSLQ